MEGEQRGGEGMGGAQNDLCPQAPETLGPALGL